MSRVPLSLLSVIAISACSNDVSGPVATSPASAASASVSVASTLTVVMSGLNSPRGLSWGPEGGLYVAEAGTSAINGACIPFLEGPTLNTKCYSGTGSVSRLWKGSQTRVATGLASTFIVQSGFASGPQDISFSGRGNAMVAIGWGGDPALRPSLGAAANAAGTIIQLQPSGTWRVVADISAFEGATNPAGGPIERANLRHRCRRQFTARGCGDWSDFSRRSFSCDSRTAAIQSGGVGSDQSEARSRWCAIRKHADRRAFSRGQRGYLSCRAGSVSQCLPQRIQDDH
jgi:hypothetical protein